MPANDKARFYHPLVLNGKTFANNIGLAPMAGYSHKALRLFTRQYGAGFAVTEMVSLEGLWRRDKKTLEFIDFADEPDTTVQLFGKADTRKFYEVSKFLQAEAGVKVIDVNFGCPVRKVIRNGAGSDLLKTPQAMGDIVRALKDSGVLASAKIRSGTDHVHLEPTITELEKAGVDILTLHPRTAVQMYNGHADWSLIKEARQMTKAVLIGSGDIKTPEDAYKMLHETGCDGVMIGRQAVGAAYIYNQIRDFLTTGHYTQPDLDGIKTIVQQYARLFIDVIGRDFIVPIRSALIQYVRLYQNSKEIRNRLSRISTFDELLAVLKDW